MITDMFENLGENENYYGWFSSICGLDEYYANQNTNAVFVSNQGEVVVFSVPLKRFYVNEINWYDKVYRSLMGVSH